MRQVLLGAVTGLALAAGILGLHTSGVGGADRALVDPSRAGQDRRVESVPTVEPPRIVASHDNSNTEEVGVGLNGNLIAGRPTIICTGDATLVLKLREAVTEWNSRLSGLGFDAFDLHELSNTPECERLSGVHVVVRTGDCPNDGACYRRIAGDEDTPPRQTFRRSGKSFAEIEYESTDIRKSTFMHELGHVLGLSDYTSCAGLRVPGSGAATDDPDLNDQHFALMYNAPDRLCRPRDEDTITDRDLRDLYEAYHVGAVTSVSLQSDVTVGSNEVTVDFDWGSTGIDELYHNAAHVAVFAQDVDSSSTWNRVGVVALPSTGSLGMSIEVDVPGVESEIVGAPSRYPTKFRLVGLTQGDIRWLGRQINSPVNQPRQWTFDREVVINSVTYTEGDPTYVKGTLVSSGVAVRNPRVLSASLSPRYCWTGDNLVVSALVSGGSDDRTYLLKGVDETTHTAGATGPCGSSSGNQSFSVRGEWRSVGDSPITMDIDDLELYVRSRPTALAFQFTRPLPACAAGTSVDVAWTHSGGVAPVNVWIDGAPVSGVTQQSVTCSGTAAPKLEGFALGADGSGSADTTYPSPERLSVTPVVSSIGSRFDALFKWRRVGSATGYEVQYDPVTGAAGDIRWAPTSSVVPMEPDDRFHTFTDLSVGVGYEFRVRAVIERAKTGWARVSHTVPTPIGPSISKIDPTSRTVGVFWSLGGATLGTGGSTGAGGASGAVASFYFDARLDKRVESDGEYSFEHRSTYRITPGSGETEWEHRFENDPGAAPIVESDTWYRVGVRLVDNILPTEWDFDGCELRKTFAYEGPAGLSRSESGGVTTLTWTAVAGLSYEVRKGESETPATVGGGSYMFSGSSAESTLYVRVQGTGDNVGRGGSAWAAAAPPLTLTVSPQSRHCVVHQQDLPITWQVAGGVAPYTVTVGGAASSGGAHEVDCPTTAGTTTVPLVATDIQTPAASVTQNLTLIATRPLVVSAVADPATCETDGQTQIDWTVLGGANPHTVTVDGETASTSPTTVDCGAVGSQLVVVAATDSSAPDQLSHQMEVTLTVTEPAPDPLAVTALASPTTCETGDTVSISWSVSGGTTPYAVTVDGVADSASPRTVTCQSTAGTQSVVVAATDAGDPQLSDSTTVQLTVSAPAPDPLVVMASASPSSCETGETVSVSWSVSGGTSPYTVRVDGVLDSASPRTVTCQSVAGSQSVAVIVLDSGAPQLSTVTFVTLTVTAPPPPLTLTASASPTSCETDGSVVVSWSVSGGTSPYTVTVDGLTDSASPRTVTCQSTAGTQSVVVAASDAGSPQLNDSRTLSLTVTIPTLTFEGRARARIRSSGRVEFCFQLRNQSCILPSSRYLTPANMVAGRWYHTSWVSGTVGAITHTLGKVSVMKPSGASYIQVCFTPLNLSRQCPSPNNFSWGSVPVDAWRSAGYGTYTIVVDEAQGARGQSEADGGMSGPNDQEPDTPGTDGGAMWSEDEPPGGG